jgi:hypothetical protein
MLKKFYSRHSKLLGFMLGTVLFLILVGGGVMAAASAWITPIISPAIAVSPTGTITVNPIVIAPVATNPACTFYVPNPNISGQITDGEVYTASFTVNVTNTTVTGTDGLDPNFHSITIDHFTGLPAGWTVTGNYTSTEGIAPNQYQGFVVTITSPILHVADSGLVISPVIYLAVQ